MRLLATANILAIGSELLTPDRIDTNSLYLTGQLNELGIVVTHKCVVGDDVDDLQRAVTQSLDRADVVLVSGGLGPTADDLTREAVSACLGLRLTEDADVLEGLRIRFAKRGGVMPENNRRQAMVPEGATVLPNPRGSAPGLMLTHGEQVVVLLPGPPRELEPMFEAVVREHLLARTSGARLRRRVLKIAGLPESRVDEIAAPIYAPWASQQPAVQTTILASPGLVELRVAAIGNDVAAIDAHLDRCVRTLAEAVGDSTFSHDGRSLERVVGDALLAKGLTLALAESCTGGMVAARITDIAGSSQYFRGGVVAYANQIKTRALGVPAELIDTHGAVSEPVAEAMARGARQALGADVAAAVTGIAGPDGGTETKPVGTVCFSVSGPGERLMTVTRVVPGDRQLVRQWAVMVALDLIRRAVR